MSGAQTHKKDVIGRSLGSRRRIPAETRGKLNEIVVTRDVSAGGRGRRNPLYPHINIRETAKRMQINESHLSHLLSGRSRPTIEMAKKLADVFQTTMEEVLQIYDGHKRGKRNGKRFNVPGFPTATA